MGRLPDPDSSRKYQIQQLWEVHHEILRRLVVGQKAVQIAEDLGITPAMVSYVRNSEIGRRQLGLMGSAATERAIDVKARIKELASQAVQVLEEAMDPDNPIGIRFRAATDLLDRAGHGAPRVLRTENLHAVLTQDDILEIKRRAILMGQQAGILVHDDGET